MEDFEYRGKKVQFWRYTGEVLGNNKYSETHVSSSGGGGYINRYGGRIDAPTIHSSNTLNHEFWIRTDDGREEDFKLRNRDIPLRTGQRISVICASKKRGGQKWIAYRRGESQRGKALVSNQRRQSIQQA